MNKKPLISLFIGLALMAGSVYIYFRFNTGSFTPNVIHATGKIKKIAWQENGFTVTNTSSPEKIYPIITPVDPYSIVYYLNKNTEPSQLLLYSSTTIPCAGLTRVSGREMEGRSSAYIGGVRVGEQGQGGMLVDSWECIN